MIRRLTAIETRLVATIDMLEGAKEVGRDVLYLTDELQLDIERSLDRLRRALAKVRARLIELDAGGTP